MLQRGNALHMGTMETYFHRKSVNYFSIFLKDVPNLIRYENFPVKSHESKTAILIMGPHSFPNTV